MRKPCRVIGVTDLCDYPADALSRPKVAHTTVDTSNLSMEEVETRMQQFKAEGRPPFQVDGTFLARHQPGLLLTQDSCRTCDPSTSTVMEVPPFPILAAVSGRSGLVRQAQEGTLEFLSKAALLWPRLLSVEAEPAGQHCVMLFNEVSH